MSADPPDWIVAHCRVIRRFGKYAFERTDTGQRITSFHAEYMVASTNVQKFVKRDLESTGVVRNTFPRVDYSKRFVPGESYPEKQRRSEKTLKQNLSSAMSLNAGYACYEPTKKVADMTMDELMSNGWKS